MEPAMKDRVAGSGGRGKTHEKREITEGAAGQGGERIGKEALSRVLS